MLQLATWNVLAPAYALPHRYAGAALDDLVAEARVPRVHERLARLLADCDVVALQEADSALVAWLRDEAAASVVHAPRPSAVDGVVLASTRHTLAGTTRSTSDGRRTYAAATVDGTLLVTVHLDPEWPAKRLAGVAQARDVLAWLESVDVPRVVLLGDINAAWASRTGDVLRRAGFVTVPAGATAATNGKCRELDVVAVRGCSAIVLTPTGLPPAGSSLWLPTADLPSDHAPLLATVE